MTTMNYIGLEVHKKTISYCVKDVSGVESFLTSRGPIAQVPQKVCRTHSSGLAGVTYRSRSGLSS